VQGYFNTWPAFVRKEWEAFAADEKVYRPFPPSPEAVDRMLETMRWVQWLEVEQRHLIWMRAKEYEWKDICRRFGCDRTTAWRRWQRALGSVAARLNAERIPMPPKILSQVG
jgi:DNA-directed RNA polymerase specialized sigma24 family protein